MTTDTMNELFTSTAGTGPQQGGARFDSNLEVVCLFSAVGLVLTALALAVSGPDEVALILSMAG